MSSIRTFLWIFVFYFINILSNYAQNLDQINIHFNLGSTYTIPYRSKVELSTSQYDIKKTEYKPYFGYYLEILTIFQIQDRLTVSYGSTYSRLSYKIKYFDRMFVSEGILDNFYLNIPVSLNYQLFKKIPFSVSAGQYLGFLLHSTEKGTSYVDTSQLTVVNPADPTLYVKQKYYNDISKYYKYFDYGLLLQLIYEFKLNSKFSFTIVTKFNYGLMNILSKKANNLNSIHSTANEWKNYYLTLGLGFKLPIEYNPKISKNYIL